MSLSINKLEKILKSNKLIPQKFYKLYGVCAFIQVFSVTNADQFMIYIPSKYEFNIDNKNNVYKIKPISLDENDKDKDEIADEYAKSPDRLELEKKYEEIELEEDIEPKKHDKEEISDRLVNNYKRPINLKEVEMGYKVDIKCIFRQLKRFKFCVQNLKYKLIIKYKCYLCVLHLDDSLECFLIKNCKEIDDRELLVMMDLEVFFEKMNTINDDINQIRDGLQKILNKNQIIHSRSLLNILEKNKDFLEYYHNIEIQKNKYLCKISKFEELIEKLNSIDDNVNKKLAILDKQKKSDPTLQGDIQYSHQKSKIDKEMMDLDNTREEIIETISLLRNKLSNITLTIDKIIFDNIVMIDKIFDNLNILKKI